MICLVADWRSLKSLEEGHLLPEAVCCQRDRFSGSMSLERWVERMKYALVGIY